MTNYEHGDWLGLASYSIKVKRMYNVLKMSKRPMVSLNSLAVIKAEWIELLDNCMQPF